MNLNSLIIETLAAGSYTLETTAYYSDEAGIFTLPISCLIGDDGNGAEKDTCTASSIDADGETTGEWTSGCQSQ